jgi:hypothetical protein
MTRHVLSSVGVLGSLRHLDDYPCGGLSTPAHADGDPRESAQSQGAGADKTAGELQIPDVMEKNTNRRELW